MQHKDWVRAKEFLKECAGKNVHIINDYDADGIGGALTLERTLKLLGAIVTRNASLGRGNSLRKETLEQIKKNVNPERIIINDQDPKSYGHYESYREVFPTTPTLIIDHHHVQKYEDAIFIHPKTIRGIDGAKLCSAKFIYDLCTEITDTTSFAWLCCLGILGDVNTEEYKDFLQEVIEREGYKLPKDPYESAFGKVVEAIDCCLAADEEDLLEFIEQLANAETLEQAVALGNPRSEVREELDKYIKLAMDIDETKGPINWLPIESEFRISSWVTTLISLEYPHRIFIGYRETPSTIDLNARYQDATIHLGEVLKPLAEKYGGRAGGHAPASGGSIPKQHWEEFKIEAEKIIEKALEKKKS